MQTTLTAPSFSQTLRWFHLLTLTLLIDLQTPPSLSLSNLRRFHLVSSPCSSAFCFRVPWSSSGMELTGPRWKGKGFADTALANPMSEIVSRLRTSLSPSMPNALLSGRIALLEAEPEAADLLERASIGKNITTFGRDKQCFQLGPEESFYLYHGLTCIRISREDGTAMAEAELWNHFCSQRKAFPELYKAYSHLRSKNWVVRSGTHYGADFVAYRHHPALVHAEYAVLVIPENDGKASSTRLSAWPDLCCSLRLSGSVAKTLLILYVSCCSRDRSSVCSSEEFSVDERIIRRWIPERSREGICLAGDDEVQ